MSRTLNLRGTFTEGESRNLNGRILRNSSNPNPPPRVITSNDFDRYINILKANNRYPIPKEQTLSIYTTPHTIDKDIYLAKDSVISFFGTAPAYLNKFSLSTNNTVYDISDKFTFNAIEINSTISNSEEDYSLIYIEYISNFYKITYIVHRVASEITINIPANSYKFSAFGNYNAQDIPVLTFYEGEQSILSLSAESTPTVDGQTQIATSSLITQFVFTST
mgnify:CR=1 FL=1